MGVHVRRIGLHLPLERRGGGRPRRHKAFNGGGAQQGRPLALAQHENSIGLNRRKSHRRHFARRRLDETSLLHNGNIIEETAQAILAAIKDSIRTLAGGSSPVYESIKGYPSKVDEAAASTMKMAPLGVV
jgi:hypothetical protein